MAEPKPSKELVAFLSLPDRERKVEHVDVWLPSEFVRSLEQWAKREGVPVDMLIAEQLGNLINMESFVDSNRS